MAPVLHLHSVRDTYDLITIPVNDCEALRNVFAKADADTVFFQMMFMEPIQGEVCPFMAVTREFYDLAKLTGQRGTLLLVDSIQAGMTTNPRAR